MNYLNKVIAILITLSFSIIQASPVDSTTEPATVYQQIDTTLDSAHTLKAKNTKTIESLSTGEKVGAGCCIGLLGAGIIVAIIYNSLSHMADGFHVNMGEM